MIEPLGPQHRGGERGRVQVLQTSDAVPRISRQAKSEADTNVVQKVIELAAGLLHRCKCAPICGISFKPVLKNLGKRERPDGKGASPRSLRHSGAADNVA